jgi:G3E family GTPase
MTFDFVKAEESAGWIKELENEHIPESDEYGIGSFVFRSKKPFHPERFLDFVTNKFPSNIIRSKGLFWIASRSNQALVWSSAGGSIKTDPAGVWWDSMPFNERINFASFVDNQEQIESDWDSDFGDRKIELVFIGQNLDRHAISKMLQKCLISDSELSYWKNGDFQKADNWPIQQYN